MMTTRFIPLEIQYHILFFACEDWLQQPVLSRVCTAWKKYIATSPKAFLARYNDTTTSYKTCKYQHPLSWEPRFHNAISHHRQFMRAQHSKTKFVVPCRFTKTEDGKVVDVSPEVDLSLFLLDPLFEPMDPVTRTGIAYGKDLQARSIFLQAPRRSYSKPWECEGTVGSFLRSLPGTIRKMVDLDVLQRDNSLPIRNPKVREIALSKYFELLVIVGDDVLDGIGIFLYLDPAGSDRVRYIT